MTPRDGYTCEWVECLHAARGRARRELGKRAAGEQISI